MYNQLSSGGGNTYRCIANKSKVSTVVCVFVFRYTSTRTL